MKQETWQFIIKVKEGYAVKKRIRMIICFLLTAILALQGVTAYAAQVREEMRDKKNKDGKIKIVCMIFPQYDWLREVIGEKIDNYDIKLLLDNGSELHSYQPTVEDMAEISSSDFFFYVGGESDAWVKDALKSAKNPNLKAVSLLEMLEDYAKVEEEIEGAMEHKHEHGDTEHEEEVENISAVDIHREGGEHELEVEKEHEHGKEYDEHMWLSLKNAEVAVERVSQIISELDTENAFIYQKNSDQYKQKLQSLDMQYKNTVENAKRKIILFGDRFPFRYLADDYGLTYYAAFEGCSAETGVSFETIIFLAGKMDEEKLPVIFTLENANKQLAQVIVENTNEKNQEILTLHSMQSVMKRQIKQEGFSYLGLMQENLNVLNKALN